jgi:RimJ/RimL family protein N-acetyltransferase
MLMNESMSHDHEVQLVNERLLLRAFRLEDADEIYQAVCESKPELTRWLPWCHTEYAPSDTLEFLNLRGQAFRQDQEHAFAIFERNSGRFAGATGINQIDRHARRANLGYWLRTDCTGKGFATQATLLVAHWAFDQLGLERIEIVAATENIASQRVAMRAGATREGIARRRLRMGDEQRDAVVFSLVPSDLAGKNSR